MSICINIYIQVIYFKMYVMYLLQHISFILQIKYNTHTCTNYYFIRIFLLQHVDEENSYLCGYLKIKGLTEEFPTLTTFFDGEIISKKYPFLTRKWDADEDVDRKHWVCILLHIFLF